jgi:hypothetical protein
MSSLHPDVLALVEMKPAEDLLLSLLRGRLTGVRVQTLIEDDQEFPAIVVRTNGDWGAWGGDPRFIDSGQVNVQAFCSGIDSDQDAALLSEAVRVLLRDSINVEVPGLGHLTRVEMVGRPRRAPDWATATGPVQYADLPTGVQRYETLYDVSIKRSL